MTKSFNNYKVLRISWAAQSGAAMVESILILSLMVVLLAGIPSIAKRQDVRQASVDANRYVTWEMTVSSAADRELVIDRFYSAPDASIRSAPTENNDNYFWRSQYSPLVREHAFRAAASPNLRSVPESIGHSLVDSRSLKLDVFERAADAGSVAETITGTVRTVSDWTGSSSAIAPNRGIIQTALSVGVGHSDLREESQPVTCSGVNDGAMNCLSIRSAILVDGWEASTNADVEEGAKAMVPTKLLDPLGEVLDALSIVPLFEEFEDMDESFGCVNTSLLPTKELTGTLSTDIGTPNEC